MHKRLFKFTGNCTRALGWVRGCGLGTVLFLATTLAAPRFAAAISTTSGAVSGRARHSQTSSARRAPRHTGRPKIQKRTHRTRMRKASRRGHRSLRRRRRSGSRRATGAQKYPLAATLDNVRTHSHAGAGEPNSVEDVPPVVGAHPEVPKPLALDVSGADQTAGDPPGVQTAVEAVPPAAQASPSVQEASDRDLPAFNLSVPRSMPVALRGSHEVLVHQNIIADVEGLSRIQDDAQLSAMVHSGDLVALPASSALAVDSRLPMNRRYCRPWTAKFLSDLAAAHESMFGRPLQLTSAVRTVAFQRHLARYNGNAAPAYGDTASPHLTGQAIDLGKKGMSQHEIAWMRTILGQLQNSGRVDVEEEFEQACFHISVYKTYAPHATPATRLMAHADTVPAGELVSRPAIGAVAQPAAGHATTTLAALHRPPVHTHSYYAHYSRRAAARRRRRHHSSMSLLAARMH